MRKLNLDHVAAISRAEGAIHPTIIQNMSPHHRLQIENDLTRLADIKKFILKALYEPGLPLTTEIPEPKETYGDTNQQNTNGR